MSESLKSVGAALENSKGLPTVYTELGKSIKANPSKFEELQKSFQSAKNDEDRIAVLKDFALKNSDLIKLPPGEAVGLKSWWITVTVTVLVPISAH